MNKSYLIAIVLALMLFSSRASAASGLSAFLSTYIPNSTISNSTLYNQTMNGVNYVIVQLPGRNNYVVVSNSSAGYSLVTNVSTIDNLLGAFLVKKYYPSGSVIESLNSTMREYMEYTAPNLTACLVETGLNINTCTLSNQCFSCQTIPVCKKALDALGGPDTPFGYGIINFSRNYTIINSSYNSYFSLLSKINSTNAGTIAPQLSEITDNLSAIQSAINQNPIFPPPPYLSYQQCTGGGNPSQQPWYCVAVGYCFSIPFNTTALSNIQGTLNNIESSLPSASGTLSISENSSALANNYITQYLSMKNGNAFSALINSTYPIYTSLVANSTALLQKYNNETLNASLSSLEAQYSAIESKGSNQSISAANSSIRSLLASTASAYGNASLTYQQVYGIAQNNSIYLLRDQLSYRQVPTKLAAMASAQQNINIQLNGRLNSSDISAMLPALQSINIESALYVAPLTIGYLIKRSDQPFINTLLNGANSYAPSRISSAPLYAAMESFIIGLLLLLVIYIITYFRVIRKGLLKNNKKRQRKWIMIFIAIFIFILAYTYVTYAYAQNANAFLPFSYFVNSVKTSGNLYIALNGSAASNSSIAECVSKLEATVSSPTRIVQTISLRNYSCVSGNNISTLGLNCYVNLLGSTNPVIYISQSQNNMIVYKGLYGTVLYASGNVTSGPSCALATLFNNV